MRSRTCSFLHPLILAGRLGRAGRDGALTRRCLTALVRLPATNLSLGMGKVSVQRRLYLLTELTPVNHELLMLIVVCVSTAVVMALGASVGFWAGFKVGAAPYGNALDQISRLENQRALLA